MAGESCNTKWQLYYQPITQSLSHLFPHISPAIWPQAIDFSLIRPPDPLPILHSPLFMPLCKFSSSLPMVGFKVRPFLLHHSYSTIILELSMHCLWRDSAVGNICKWFGGLNSTFNLPSMNKMRSIDNIGRSKLGGMTNRGLQRDQSQEE